MISLSQSGVGNTLTIGLIMASVAFASDADVLNSYPADLVGEHVRTRTLDGVPSSGSITHVVAQSMTVTHQSLAVDEFLVAASYVLAVNQVPVPRDVQQITSTRFADYWD